jgi:hypothetical protein
LPGELGLELDGAQPSQVFVAARGQPAQQSNRGQRGGSEARASPSDEAGRAQNRNTRAPTGTVL